MNLKDIIVIAFAIPAVVFLSISCEKDKGPFIIKPANIPIQPTDTNKNPTDTTDTTPPPPVIPEPTSLSYTVSFESEIKPIIKANCMGQGCHNPMHPSLDLRLQVAYNQLLFDGKNAPYVDTLEPKKSIIYLHLVGIRLPMPKDRDKLQQSDIDIIYSWIAQGAKKN